VVEAAETMNTTAEVCQLAQNLARNCYAVFPCLPDKRPATPCGFKDASADPDRIAWLWERWPGPLIGVATGEMSGFDVLDVDAGKCPDDAPREIVEKREAARAWWHANVARIPDSRAYETGSGGIHVYFRHDPRVRCSQSVIARGVDTRGDGGYVIHWFAAGLECFDHNPPAAWPEWLLEALAPKPRTPPRSAARRPRQDSNVEDVIRRAIQRVGGAPEGAKHQELRKAARLLGGVQADAGFSDSEAVSWLRDALPPSTVKDWVNVERTALWGLESGRREPLPASRGAR
jgi:hypothetical protein